MRGGGERRRFSETVHQLGAIGFDGDIDQLLRAVGLVGPRKNLAGNTIANDNAIALAA